MSMNPVFNINAEYLASKIFHPQRPRIGATTYLNVNVLPDFVQYIKKNLSAQELISLSEYQLQTYIMELSIKQKVTESFDKFVQKIINYIRGRKQFWLNEKIIKNKENQEKQKQQQQNQHQAIRQYHTDISLINKTVPQYYQKEFYNYKKRKIPLYLSTNEVQFMDRGKQILKSNITNYAMMPAYVLKTYLQGKKQLLLQKLIPSSEKLLNTLENTCQYFLIIQKPRSFRPQIAKRRDLVRSRVLPSYLQNKDHILYNFQNQIQASSCEKQSQNIQQNRQNQLQQSQKKRQAFNQQQVQQQDSQNQYYQNFHSILKNKPNYDSKMFCKQFLINQSHNILQILKCIAYLLNNEQINWFESTWKQLEEQRIMRQKKRKQQQNQDDVQEQQQEQEKDIKQIQNRENHIKNDNSNQQIQQENQNQIDNKIKDKLKQQNQKIILENKQHITILNDQKFINKQILQQHDNEFFLKDKKQNNKIQNLDQQNQDKLSQISSQQHKMDIQNQKNQQQIFQIGIKKPIFDQAWKNPSYSWRGLTKHLPNKLLTMRQIYFVAKQFLKKDILKQFQYQRQINNRPQDKSRNLQKSLISPQISLDDIYLEFKQMIQHPEHVKLSSFKTEGITIPWDNTDYLLFLKGLLDFFFVPTNNRKIAQYMMSKNPKKQIQANHVKFVKGNYLKNMHIRIERGESGGGKKGRMQGKTQFLQKDIQFFSMRWFDKIKKCKKKKLKKRMFQQDDDAADQVDSAY